MDRPRKPKQKLTPLQAVIVILIILAGAAYQYLNQDNADDEVMAPEPAGPSTVVITEVDPEVTEPEAEPAGPSTVVITEVDPEVTEPEAEPASPEDNAPPADKPSSKFDFYVLALSWSPDYCASNGENDPQQCSMGKKLGFVLHGLWPQYNRGYPSNCSTQKLSKEIKAQFPDLYPSAKLYDHEWEKHGTCSGLKPERYLSLSQQLKDSVVIPDMYRILAQPVRVTTEQFKQELVGVNTGLSESAVAVYCSGSGRFLKEILVCFSTGGQPVPCSAEVQNKAGQSCRNKDFLVRNIQ